MKLHKKILIGMGWVVIAIGLTIVPSWFAENDVAQGIQIATIMTNWILVGIGFLLTAAGC